MKPEFCYKVSGAKWHRVGMGKWQKRFIYRPRYTVDLFRRAIDYEFRYH